MNYRHAFHAGNVGDVLKHMVQIHVLAHLRAKAKPFAVIDTHAGIGAYDLTGPAAIRTGEWRHGLGRLWGAADPPEAVRAYLDHVRAIQEELGATIYPGSPLISAHHLRPGDRMVAVERHPEDYAVLADLLGRAPGVIVREGDGYAALAALLPPAERRGLILIDPPFEEREEYQALALALGRAHRRFATGVYMLWYPIKDPGAVAVMRQMIQDSAVPRVLAVELTVRPTTVLAGLAGCGLILVNPPWRLEETLREALPWLAARLETTPGAGGWSLEWLRGEA
ncbi:23S rRNA (adenine(2030)-N(6))-methyltransferase RlmJ [Roseospira marina]|uniref:Ribosomal RNA large subunit methyltransferase J n=1 Tax=Roseospira marina TaxID=140057 RepID=A0A5M6ICZ4_9PROT|nr:23S rRNA (adenine(2030)-N(6))-methyltransferase RlmJ [Roseospira marina]KAA5606150.1 23S rRNA (adenine(2030)-N(6))-methyltransferase RlmJ [Roseospira marina]MBB4314289.1 23S rRNA (adenine2030-N6)-methyltransferase [Roseospira marina]MBB5087449.1 23S rRNA (adenine2030-N6)-methyltransferase [Roseospira marina]